MSNARSGPDTVLAELLLSLELQLMDPAFRKDRAAVSSLLAEDFSEFGSSGRVWSREAILDLLESEP
jgi:ribonuclease HI